MRDIQIVIRAQSIFYAVATVLVIYAIDKKLLVLSVFAFALAIMIVPAFAASTDIERVLDLSASSIDWGVTNEKNHGVCVSTTPRRSSWTT
jgi:hypothetical protein